jgi:outer membrane protein OmpA-like peptidoglycan-associated protein
MKLNRPLLTSVTLFAALQVLACGPTVFEDATALQVVGDPPLLPAPPPPPPPEPTPEPEPPKRVVVENNRIAFEEKIQFDFDKATIKPESDSLLQEIIKVIKENPHIKKIAIEGHTSSEGSDRHNLKLSDARAKAVMNYMITNGGLPKEMFTAKGFGETKLIAEETDEAGKEKNRRVEFNIVAQDVTEKKVEIDPKSGEKKVLEEKTAAEVDPEAAPAPAGDAAAATPPAKDAAAKPAAKDAAAKPVK